MQRPWHAQCRAGAMAHNSPVARISEAHPGSSWAGPWRVPDADFGLIGATRPLMTTRLVASPLAVERGVYSGQAEALQDTAQCARIAYAVGVQAGAARALHVDEHIVDEKGLAGVLAQAFERTQVDLRIGPAPAEA